VGWLGACSCGAETILISSEVLKCMRGCGSCGSYGLYGLHRLTTVMWRGGVGLLFKILGWGGAG
jgi:hypothetical protein